MLSRRPWIILFPFCVAYYVSFLLRNVNAVIAPELIGEFALSPSALGFLSGTYLLAFAAAQLPLGIALDRIEVRKVLMVLMLVASLGVAVFATGHGLPKLAVGRALAGLGVAGCLMAALKMSAAVFGPEQQASVTGIIMASGAAGALTATAPMKWAMPLLGWRGELWIVSGLAALAALLAATLVPRSPHQSTLAIRSELGVFWDLLRAREFWRYVPQAALFTGGFMAIQGLWAGPWLATIEGRSSEGVAAVLFAYNSGAFCGQMIIAAIATRLVRAGVPRPYLLGVGSGAALLFEATIVSGVARGAVPWFGLGLTAAAGAQVYGVTAASFPLGHSARVTTAINLVAFLSAFALQAGIGAALEVLHHRNVPPIPAFTWVFGALWAAQVLAVIGHPLAGLPGRRRKQPFTRHYPRA